MPDRQLPFAYRVKVTRSGLVKKLFYAAFCAAGGGGKESIMVKINGEELNAAGKTVAEYLASTSYDPKRIAVERNGEIVPKAKYGEIVLEDGDSVEVVSFVGGG